MRYIVSSVKAKSKKRKDRNLISYLGRVNIPLLIISVVIFDQLTKFIAQNFLPIICNSGVAFGIKGGGFLFTLIMIGFVLYMMKEERSRKNLVALALVFSGGFSNFIDRVLYSCVRDFINIFSVFPIFNFADIAITAGVLMFVYFVIKKDAKP